jgi:hypothetical protein
MKRAAQLFAIDEWGSDSRLVEKAWTSRSEPEQAFISVAVSRWHIVVTTRRDVTQLTVRGPETTATVTPIPADAEFFGIVFRLGTFMPAMPPADLVDRAVTLPAATPNSVWFEGSRWEIPTPGNADVFVDRLVRQGLILRDPVVAESLQDDVDASPNEPFSAAWPEQRASPAARSRRSPEPRRPSRRSVTVCRLKMRPTCSATPTRPTSPGH